MIIFHDANGEPVCNGSAVSLGVQGDNLVTTLTADVSEWLAEWPNGMIVIVLVPANGGAPFLANTSTHESVLSWHVVAAETQYAGFGAAALQLVEGAAVKKSMPFKTWVARSVTGSAATVPEVIPDWVTETLQQMEALTGRAETAQAAAETAQAAAEAAQDKAEQAAANAGYMFFSIDENGHLIYQRTSNVQVDFSIGADGHLYVEAAS